MNEDGKVRIVTAGAARGVVVRRPRGGGHLVRNQGGPAARPWAASGSIDVEALAVWAYRDQRVDRHATRGLHAIEAMAAGHFVAGSSSDGCAALAAIAHMGCRVDNPGMIISDDVHPAADAVASELLLIEGGGAVAFHARSAGQPSGWAPPKRWYRAALWVEPWVEAHWERTGPGTSSRFCRIIETTTWDEIERRRAEYRAWWDALDLLAWRLSMRAMGFIVLRPSAPREPWAEAA